MICINIWPKINVLILYIKTFSSTRKLILSQFSWASTSVMGPRLPVEPKEKGALPAIYICSHLFILYIPFEE